jgi:hypothetical protein
MPASSQLWAVNNCLRRAKPWPRRNRNAAVQVRVGRAPKQRPVAAGFEENEEPSPQHRKSRAHARISIDSPETSEKAGWIRTFGRLC